MSWESYTQNLTQQGFCGAWIIEYPSGAIWAESSADEKMTPDQALKLCKTFDDKSLSQAGGIKIGNLKFFYLQSDDMQIQCKQGKGGLSAAKATKCIVCGQYDDKLSPGQARSIVEKMKDYLGTVGF